MPPPDPGQSEFARRCDAAESLALEDLGRAERESAQLVDEADQTGRDEDQARALRVQAIVHVWRNRFPESLADLDRALVHAERCAEIGLAAQIRMSRVHALARLGRLDEAWATAEDALRGFEEIGSVAGAAKALANLGVVHRMRDDPARALAALTGAQAALEDDAVAAAQVQSNRAEVLLELDRFDEAEAAFRGAESVLADAGQARGAAIVGGNLADLMRRQGRLGPALRAFETARSRFEAEGVAGDSARLAAEQADAFLAADLRAEAADAYRAALPPLKAAGLRIEQARALLGYGLALHRLGRRADAESALADAADTYAALHHEYGLGRVRLAQAEIALASGALETAARALAEATAAFKKRPAERGLAAELASRVALAGNDLDAAERSAHDAADVAMALDLAPLLAAAMRQRAEIAERRGRRDEARTALQGARTALERQRIDLQGDRLRLALDATLAGVGEATACLALADGAIDDAFDALEHTKARGLLDLVAGTLDVDGTSGHGADTETAVAAAVVTLRRELTVLGGRLWDLDGDADDARATVRDAVESRLERLAPLEARLAAAQGPPGALAPPAALERVRSDLRPDEVLVEFAVLRARVHALVVPPRGDAAVVDLGSADAVHDELEELRFEVARAQASPRDACLIDDGMRALDDLRRRLAAPLGSALASFRRAHLVPHGMLHDAPLAALFADHLVTVTPSATLRLHLAPPRPGHALLVGVPDARAPRIAGEVDALDALLPDATVLRGEEATLERIRAEAAGAAIIHLACHGRFDRRSPMSSALRLGSGWVGAHDLATLPLHGALVVLSGCETGRAVVTEGEDLLGLVRGFFAAGASGLVLAAWPLADESARLWMESFHRIWHNGPSGDQASAASAAAGASNELRRQFPHPAHWAPYQLLGRS